MQAGGQALAFTRTRQAAELIHRYVAEQLQTEHSPLADKVRAYRGGYLPNERREIEQELFNGMNPLGQYLRVGGQRYRVPEAGAARRPPRKFPDCLR